MTTPVASLADELRHELLQARAQLVEARFHQAEKDTLEARAAVARSLSFIDAVLACTLPPVRPRGTCTPRSEALCTPLSCGQLTRAIPEGPRVRIGTAIDTAIAEVLPSDKAAIVCGLPLASKQIETIGDAPARSSVACARRPGASARRPGNGDQHRNSADALAHPRRLTARASRRGR